jgi:hypothetical protein
MKRLFNILPFILISLLFAACSAKPSAKTAASPTADSGPNVSFTSPEPGASVPFGPVQVLLLSEDPRGTAQVEILVYGISVATVPSPDTTRASVIVEYLWQPSAPGKYVLQAHAQNNAGTWGDYSSLELTVAGEQGPTETPTVEVIPTEKPQPTAQATDVIATQSGPTQTSSGPDIPATPTRSGISLKWSFSYFQMYRYGSACEPQQNSIFVEVSGLSKDEILGVMVFFRPMEDSTGTLWNWWTTGMHLELFPSGLYGRGFSTFRMVKRLSSQPQTYWPYLPATVLYQFAISAKDGSIIYRSEIYRNLHVIPC